MENRITSIVKSDYSIEFAKDIFFIHVRFTDTYAANAFIWSTKCAEFFIGGD